MTAHGKFVWHDLMTTDVEASKRFYSELFAWRIVKGDHGEYLHIHAGERGIGGISAIEPGRRSPSHWSGYLAADAIENVVDLVGKAGGKVVAPVMDLPHVGKFAVLADPRGAAFSLYQSINELPDEDRIPAPGEFCWDELVTDDPEGSLPFYSSIYGWTHEATPMGPMGTYWLFKRGEKSVAGMLKMPAGAQHPPMWLPYVAVANAEETAARAKRLGGAVPMPVTDVPKVGRFAVLEDNTKAAIAILEPPR